MLTRRDFLQVTAATAVMAARPGDLAAATRKLSQQALLEFEAVGQVTLLNFTDCHAQLTPLYFREPSVNLGVGAATGLPPHLTGEEILKHFGLRAGTTSAYAFSAADFTKLAHQFGRIGGIDRMATLVKAIRAERPSNTLLLDGGDTWQGSYTALKTRGEDMVRVMNALGVEAMTGHWEFTYGQDRVQELVEKLDFPFLAGNVKDATWDDDIFEHTQTYERGGVNIAVIGQAFPYTPIANPRYMMADWGFGIQEEGMQKTVDEARSKGAQVVVLLSHNGMDVDLKLASRVTGIDAILGGHTHDGMPVASIISNKSGKTIVTNAGSNGKFLGVLDLQVSAGRVSDFKYRLLPVFANMLRADPAMEALINRVRAPYEARLAEPLAINEGLLYRRGNFNGTGDQLLLDALMEVQGAEIAFSPGFRWGTSLLPGQTITREWLMDMTAITYPYTTLSEMTGSTIKAILEDVADNLFNPDPYYQQGGDMVRVGGLTYSCDPQATMDKRIDGLQLNGKALEAGRNYKVAGWAPVSEEARRAGGKPIWDLVEPWLKAKGSISQRQLNMPRVAGIQDNPGLG